MQFLTYLCCRRNLFFAHGGRPQTADFAGAQKLFDQSMCAFMRLTVVEERVQCESLAVKHSNRTLHASRSGYLRSLVRAAHIDGILGGYSHQAHRVFSVINSKRPSLQNPESPVRLRHTRPHNMRALYAQR